MSTYVGYNKKQLALKNSRKTIFRCMHGPFKATFGGHVQGNHLETTTKWMTNFVLTNFLPNG